MVIIFDGYSCAAAESEATAKPAATISLRTKTVFILTASPLRKSNLILLCKYLFLPKKPYAYLDA
jgi:hypothetical protein